MKTAIQAIISEIPKGCIFDSHYVISRLIKLHSDQYLTFAGTITTQSDKTLAVHGKIGQEINKLDGSVIRKLDNESWSENIHGNANGCTCWKKL